MTQAEKALPLNRQQRKLCYVFKYNDESKATRKSPDIQSKKREKLPKKTTGSAKPRITRRSLVLDKPTSLDAVVFDEDVNSDAREKESARNESQLQLATDKLASLRTRPGKTSSGFETYHNLDVLSGFAELDYGSLDNNISHRLLDEEMSHTLSDSCRSSRSGTKNRKQSKGKKDSNDKLFEDYQKSITERFPSGYNGFHLEKPSYEGRKRQHNLDKIHMVGKSKRIKLEIIESKLDLFGSLEPKILKNKQTQTPERKKKDKPGQDKMPLKAKIKAVAKNMMKSHPKTKLIKQGSKTKEGKSRKGISKAVAKKAGARNTGLKRDTIKGKHSKELAPKKMPSKAIVKAPKSSKRVKKDGKKERVTSNDSLYGSDMMSVKNKVAKNDENASEVANCSPVTFSPRPTNVGENHKTVTKKDKKLKSKNSKLNTRSFQEQCAVSKQSHKVELKGKSSKEERKNGLKKPGHSKSGGSTRVPGFRGTKTKTSVPSLSAKVLKKLRAKKSKNAKAESGMCKVIEMPEIEDLFADNFNDEDENNDILERISNLGFDTEIPIEVDWDATKRTHETNSSEDCHVDEVATSQEQEVDADINGELEINQFSESITSRPECEPIEESGHVEENYKINRTPEKSLMRSNCVSFRYNDDLIDELLEIKSNKYSSGYSNDDMLKKGAATDLEKDELPWINKHVQSGGLERLSQQTDDGTCNEMDVHDMFFVDRENSKNGIFDASRQHSHEMFNRDIADQVDLANNSDKEETKNAPEAIEDGISFACDREKDLLDCGVEAGFCKPAENTTTHELNASNEEEICHYGEHTELSNQMENFPESTSLAVTCYGNDRVSSVAESNYASMDKIQFETEQDEEDFAQPSLLKDHTTSWDGDSCIMSPSGPDRETEDLKSAREEDSVLHRIDEDTDRTTCDFRASSDYVICAASGPVCSAYSTNVHDTDTLFSTPENELTAKCSDNQTIGGGGDISTKTVGLEAGITQLNPCKSSEIDATCEARDAGNPQELCLVSDLDDKNMDSSSQHSFEAVAVDKAEDSLNMSPDDLTGEKIDSLSVETDKASFESYTEQAVPTAAIEPTDINNSPHGKSTLSDCAQSSAIDTSLTDSSCSILASPDRHSIESEESKITESSSKRLRKRKTMSDFHVGLAFDAVLSKRNRSSEKETDNGKVRNRQSAATFKKIDFKDHSVAEIDSSGKVCASKNNDRQLAGRLEMDLKDDVVDIDASIELARDLIVKKPRGRPRKKPLLDENGLACAVNESENLDLSGSSVSKSDKGSKKASRKALTCEQLEKAAKKKAPKRDTSNKRKDDKTWRNSKKVSTTTTSLNGATSTDNEIVHGGASLIESVGTSTLESGEQCKVPKEKKKYPRKKVPSAEATEGLELSLQGDLTCSDFECLVSSCVVGKSKSAKKKGGKNDGLARKAAGKKTRKYVSKVAKDDGRTDGVPSSQDVKENEGVKPETASEFNVESLSATVSATESKAKKPRKKVKPVTQQAVDAGDGDGEFTIQTPVKKRRKSSDGKRKTNEKPKSRKKQAVEKIIESDDYVEPNDIIPMVKPKRKYVRKKSLAKALSAVEDSKESLDPEVTGLSVSASTVDDVAEDVSSGRSNSSTECKKSLKKSDRFETVSNHADHLEDTASLSGKDGDESGKQKKDNVCVVCEIGDGLIYCSGVCLSSFHPDCLGLSTVPDKFFCDECLTGNHSCFLCKETGNLRKCNQQGCGKFYHEDCAAKMPASKFESSKLYCPLHFCGTCSSEKESATCSKKKLLRCVRCPTAYHLASCLVAGCLQLTSTLMVCHKHFVPNKNKPHHAHYNVSWCFVCSSGGMLVCCESCPAAFHPACVEELDGVPEEAWQCDSCRNGKRPLYGDLVWVKYGFWRYVWFI